MMMKGPLEPARSSNEAERVVSQTRAGGRQHKTPPLPPPPPSAVHSE